MLHVYRVFLIQSVQIKGQTEHTVVEKTPSRFNVSLVCFEPVGPLLRE
jgi:hypothetical protein